MAGSSPHTAGEKSSWGQRTWSRPTEGWERWVDTQGPSCTCQLLDRAEIAVYPWRVRSSKKTDKMPMAVYWRHILEASICYFRLCQSHAMGEENFEVSQSRIPTQTLSHTVV